MAPAPQVLSYEEARATLDQAFVDQCTTRQTMREHWLVRPGDSKDVIAQKGMNLTLFLQTWAKDPLRFIKDLAWAPDNIRRFADIPDETPRPKGSIPVLPFAKQGVFIDLWWKGLQSRDQMDIFGEKSRQQAFTTIQMWLCLHAWLFRPSTDGVIATFDEDMIDPGGKGQREADSLFGRLRMFLDDFMWSFGPCLGPDFASQLKFNQQKPVGRSKEAKKKWLLNVAGLDESDDIRFKLTRPPWVVGGQAIVPGAEGNWIMGMMPSDKLGRSVTATYVILDELAHYRKFIKNIQTPDDDAYSASTANTSLRVGWGTPPKGGGSDTLLYRAIHVDPPDPGKHLIRMHWTENPAYMVGAFWTCRQCGHANPVPMHPAPKWPQDVKKCRGCRQDVVVRARGIHAPSGGDYSSPLYIKMCARHRGDKAGIAAEMEIDWGGAQTGSVFSNFDLAKALVPRAHTNGWQTIHGYDPGYSVKNPAAWSVWRFSPTLGKLRLMGYHQAPGWELWQWVPFFKAWSGKGIERMPMLHRSHLDPTAGRWSDYNYDAGAYWMLDHVAKHAHSERGWNDAVHRGDKYGTHSQGGMQSPYDAISQTYGIHVQSEYVKDDEALIQRVRDVWLPNIEIDPDIVDHRPSAPSGSYPSFVECLMQAKWVETTGQREEKKEISNNPPGVKHFIDTLKYVVMELPELVEIGMTADGYQVEEGGPGPFDDWGDGSLS